MSGPERKHGPGTWGMAARGLGFLTAIMLVVGVMVAQFSGTFSDRVTVSAVLSDTGDALVAGSDVKMRGVLVGRVGDIERSVGDPDATVELRLTPSKVASIPAEVTARSLPANFFGQAFVDLVPPASGTGAPAGPVRDGATIRQDTSRETVELQDLFNKLYRVLTAVQPAKLQASLGALAEALDGRGTKINSLITRTDAYLKALAPGLPDLQADITAFAQFAETFGEQTPAFLDSVDDLLVTTRTLVVRQQQLIELLGGGLGLAENAEKFLSESEKRSIVVARQSRQIIGTFAKHPDAFSEGFVDLGKFLGGLATHEGGRVGFDATVGFTDLPVYGAGDCPRYPGLAGPNCPKASAASARVPAQAAAARGPAYGTVYGGTAGPVGSFAEKLTLSQILSVLAGPAGAGRSAGDVGVLLAGSLLRGSTVLLPETTP